jgi:hypothetical protein
MRSLLTGYAGAFNRRHHRGGHLFQNRYKSVVVEEEPYLLELVRYLHLNPLRASVVSNLRALERYPWTGHSALVGIVARPWQATEFILTQFGATAARGRRAYRTFVAAGMSMGRRPEFQGGGVVRSAGGWASVVALRRGREAYTGDERILGTAAFVEQVRVAVAAATAGCRRRVTLARVLHAAAEAEGVTVDALGGDGRMARVARAREGAAYLWCRVAGESGRSLASAVGVSHQAVYASARRGEAASARWDAVWRKLL